MADDLWYFRTFQSRMKFLYKNMMRVIQVFQNLINVYSTNNYKFARSKQHNENHGLIFNWECIVQLVNLGIINESSTQIASSVGIGAISPLLVTELFPPSARAKMSQVGTIKESALFQDMNSSSFWEFKNITWGS